MSNIFKPKRSSTASSVPTTSDLTDGELAVNISDKKIYLRNGSDIVEVANSSGDLVDDTTPQLGGTLDTNGNLIQFGDSSSSATTTNRLQLGASQDVQIYHNVTNSKNYILTASGQNLVLQSADTGAVEIQSDSPKLIFNDITGGAQNDYSINANTGVFTMEDDTNSDTYFKYTSNAGVELYYDNSKKFETTNTGAIVTGILTATNFFGTTQGQVSYITATETLTNKTLRNPTFEGGANSPEFLETRYVNATQQDFVQLYTGGSSGSYFTQGEYQKIATITPDGNSQNYTFIIEITATSASNYQIVRFTGGLRSNTLPDLSFTVNYSEEHNGVRFIEPKLWTKETSTAAFILAFEYVHNQNLFGGVNVDATIIPRSNAQRANVAFNTTQDSEQSSIDTGFTENDPTLTLSTVNGVPVFGTEFKIEGSTDNDFETTITSVDATADRTITFPDSTGTVLTTADEGSGNGLDADTVDGIQASSFLRSDAADQKTSGTLRFNDNVILALGSGNDAEFFVNGSHCYLDLNSGIGNFYIRDGTTTRYTFDDNGDFTATGSVTATSFSGSGSDLTDIGIPQNSQTSAYTLVASDNGKHVNITTGGVTVPNGVFSSGDVVSIYNDSGSNQTITEASDTTLRLAGTSDTGNRTLAQYGLATILCVGSNEFVISGAGLS